MSTAGNSRTSSLDRLALAGVLAYSVFVGYWIVTTFWPDIALPWFNSSDEIVIAGEVIRFTGLDFHQKFYDMPGTPIMLLGAFQWAIYYWSSTLVSGLQGGINEFTFQRLDSLLILLRIDNLIFFLISGVLLFRIVSRAANRYAAAAASTILLLHPAYALTAMSLRVEPLCVCFLLAAIIVLTECSWRSSTFWAGVLAGISVACRLHAITAALPILALLLFQQTWGREASYPPRIRKISASLAAGLLVISAAMFYFSTFAASSLRSQYSLAFQLFVKASLLTALLVSMLAILYLVPKSRPAVVNTMTGRFHGLLAGIVVGFLAGSPTIFTQSSELLRSLNFYLGPAHRETSVMHLSFAGKFLAFVKFYLELIAEDKVTAVLLCLGLLLVLLTRRWRALWPYAAAGASFFLAVPPDLRFLTHHIAAWIPFYAALGAIPVAASLEAFPWKEREWRYSLPAIALAGLFCLHAEMKHSSAKLAVIARPQGERLRNVHQSREWIQTHTEDDSTIETAYYCFGPETFYSWFNDSGIKVPATRDTREYLVWWGGVADLKGKSGFVCLTPSDVTSMNDAAAKQNGAELDPFHDPHFQVVHSFGKGLIEIFLLHYDFSDGSDVRPKDLTLTIKGALRLDSVSINPGTTLSGISPMTITTSPLRWAYAASFPITTGRMEAGKQYVHLRGLVRKGRFGVGFLNRSNGSLLSERYWERSAQSQDLYIELPSGLPVDDLMIRNAYGGIRSQLVLDDAEVLTRGRRVDHWISLEEAKLSDDKALLLRRPNLTITTSPNSETAAASIPIHSPAGASRMVVRLRARVTAGRIAFAIAAADQKTLPGEQSFNASAEAVEIVLPLPAAAGLNLYIRNGAPTGTIAKVTLESIETWQLEK